MRSRSLALCIAVRCRLCGRRPTGTGSFETFIRIAASGEITAFNGHVDLGTGIRTALGQIVAEELDVSFARVVVVLGDTEIVPNQGATIASRPSRSPRCLCARRRRRRGSIWSRAQSSA